MAEPDVVPPANNERSLLSGLMRVGLLILDGEGKPVFHNRRALELMGCRHGDELTSAWNSLRNRKDNRQEGSGAARAASLRLVEEPDREQKRQFDDGQLQLDEPHIEMVPMQADGFSGTVVVLHDRGADGALGEELLLASRMRAQNYIFNALLHDLRAPLNAMEINLELLTDSCHEMRAEPGANPRGAPRRQSDQIVAVLKEELARLNRSLRMVLDHGAPQLQQAEDFDLVMTVRELAVLLRPQARAQRARLELALPAGAVFIQGQRDQIKQALLNVAINGLEALPGGGILTITVTSGEQMAQVRFCDTGAGIPEALLNQVCRMHFTTKLGGTGMGLFVARRVMEAQGGALNVANQSDGGACVTLFLPISSVGAQWAN